ncbi:MAG TPA: AAA family ATPase [Polyangiaceae bacterium]|nr:AAA family ATPase [Polyangiaceae bacterium]
MALQIDGGFGAPFADELESGVRLAANDPCPLRGWDWISAELPPLDYLVPELGLVAGAGPPHLVAGYGYSGKTVALQALALALAADKPVWGAYRCRPRRVLHLDYEQGERLTRRRYQRLARAMGIEGPVPALYVADMPGLRLSPSEEDAWRRVLDGFDLAIVDSFGAAAPGLEENTSNAREPLDMLTRATASSGCRVVVIHHARKPGADESDLQYAIRGSGAIHAAVDGAYVFAGKKDEPTSVTQIKARSHGEPVEPVALLVRDVGSESDRKWGLEVVVRGVELIAEQREASKERDAARVDAALAERVLQCVTERPGLTTRELRAAARVSGESLTRAILRLEGKVTVRQERDGRALSNRHFPNGWTGGQ